MTDLRSGVRWSKRINNAHDTPAVIVPAARAGPGKGVVGRGRGRGGRAMNQGKNPKLFGVGVGGQGNAGLDLAKRDLIVVPEELIDQKGAQKLTAIDDEGSSNPLPERTHLHLYHVSPQHLKQRIKDFALPYMKKWRKKIEERITRRELKLFLGK